MRTIKFRGKRLGKWEYGDLMHDNIGGVYIFPIDAPGLYRDYQVEPNTVGQFTGMRDLNNREIYEGDIIVQHAEDMPDIRGAVVYDEENARFGMAYTNYLESGSVTHFDTLERVKCFADCNRELTYEVIGNIHDRSALPLGSSKNPEKAERQLNELNECK